MPSSRPTSSTLTHPPPPHPITTGTFADLMSTFCSVKGKRSSVGLDLFGWPKFFLYETNLISSPNFNRKTWLNTLFKLCCCCDRCTILWLCYAVVNQVYCYTYIFSPLHQIFRLLVFVFGLKTQLIFFQFKLSSNCKMLHRKKQSTKLQYTQNFTSPTKF